MRVLVIEDEIIIAEDIRQILQSLGHEVVGIALNYTQAMQMIDSQSIDLALIDIVLSGSKTGIDVAAEIRQRHHFPFIFLTSHADAATVKKAKLVQPDGYLLKPFSKDDIFITLEMVFAKGAEAGKPDRKLAYLSERETDVFLSLLKGFTDQEIADDLYISLNTVKTHLKNIYKKLEVKNRLEAVTIGTRMSL